jgi:hypothetical protein
MTTTHDELVPFRAGAGAPRCHLAIEGDDVFLPFDGLLDPEAGPLVAYLEGAPKELLATHAVLDAPGALVVRRSRVEAVLAAHVAAGLVALRPVRVASLRNPSRPRPAPFVDDDLCALWPLVELPADRDAHEPGAVVAGDPSSVCLARMHEFPLDLWANRATLDALASALGGALRVGRASPSPPVDLGGRRAISCSDGDAARAIAAHREAASRAGRADDRVPHGWARHVDDALRAALLASPRFAYLLGRVEGPRDDTRAAACADASYAVLYGRDVDRGPHDATRTAAAHAIEAAIAYARFVDRGPHPALREAVAASYRRDAYEEAALLASARNARRSAPIAAAPAAGPKRGARAAKPREEAVAYDVVALQGAAGAVYVDVPGAPRHDAGWGLALGDGDVVVSLHPTKAGDALAKKLGDQRALSNQVTCAWVLRRDVGEAMFEGVAGVRLLRARAEHRGAAIDADLVYVDVGLDRPLDRRAPGLGLADPTSPWSTDVLALHEAVVLGEPPPHGDLELARVAEFPSLLVATRALLRRWTKLRAPVAALKPPHAHLRPMPLFPADLRGPAWPAIDGAAALDAYIALARGDAARRAEALASPWFAYLVGRHVDCAPHDDARRAACLHSSTAALYARFVDAVPRDDTREAAAGTYAAIVFYAKFVDRALGLRAREALVGLGADRAAVAELEASLAKGCESRCALASALEYSRAR